MIEAIAHTTDFSEAGQAAFNHALRLAMEYRCRLDLLHVRALSDEAGWDKFPHVRETLVRWGKLPANAEPSDVVDKLGVEVRKVDIRNSSATEGLADYLERHRPALLVMATHGRSGVSRWLSGSVSFETSAKADVPALLFGPEASSFVDPATGEFGLKRVLAPVDHKPSPRGPLLRATRLLGGLGATFDIVHVGTRAPRIGEGEGWPSIRLVEGDAVETILAEAEQADLVAMPTAGRHGFLDALRGSTTERVVHKVTCPVLALHAR